MIQNKILDLFNIATDQHPKAHKQRFEYFTGLMLDQGAVLRGCGWYSSVWGLDGRVFKINSGQQGARDGFIHWVAATRVHQPHNPHLPWVGDLSFDNGRYCIELESLQPLTNELAKHMGADGLDSMSTFALASYAEKNRDIANTIDLAYNLGLKLWPESEPWEVNTIRDKLDNLDFSYGRFDNLMHRNGVIVFNDPVSYSESSVKLNDVIHLIKPELQAA